MITAGAYLREGKLVAFPTETVYGLGADATNDRAVARIFAVKHRPRFNPLIIHVPSREAAQSLGVFDRRAEALAAAFWPGPITLVLPRRPTCGISLLCGAGLDTLALRVPAHSMALDLLAAADRPLAAPSANRSGRISPTLARHVAEELGSAVDLILDGGPCAIGVESTVLDLTGGDIVLLREGGVARERIEAVVGKIREPARTSGDSAQSALRSPGLMQSHYAPERPVRLRADAASSGEALLGFGRTNSEPDYQLSAQGDLEEAAARLFVGLRALDRPPFTGIAVTDIPNVGIGRAINDRLARAAAPRPSRVE